MRFNSFVIFGAMRTGSNFLEATLNEVEGITSFGELFNPHFMGKKNTAELFGVTLQMREAKPQLLLERIRENTPGLTGFRFFQEHNPRIFKAVLNDPTCAKIVLTRDPLDSFISLQIAKQTGQWMLLAEKNRKTTKIHFDETTFATYLDELMAFYGEIRHQLQITGQTAFHIGYYDLAEKTVLNGLTKWLGIEEYVKHPSHRLKRQNSTELAEKVENPEDIAPAVARLDLLNPDFRPYPEPRKNAPFASFVAASNASLLYMPVQGPHLTTIETWMAEIDGGDKTQLVRELSHAKTRGWREKHPGYRSFTVISHPLERAHDAFLKHILSTGPDSFVIIRNKLRNVFRVDLPEGEPDESYSIDHHRSAFLGFLRFIWANLAGHTSIRVDPSWASQEAVIQGFCTFHPPDMVIRDENLTEGLQHLASLIGQKAPPLRKSNPIGPYELGDIYNENVETAGRRALARDYLSFGFSNWKPLTPL